MQQYKYILNGSELSLAPAGWDSASINYVRNEFYSSISRSFVLNLRFVLKKGGGGLEILEEFNLYGVNASMTFIIKERNTQTDDYDLIFDGILDFNPDKIVIDYENYVFEIGAIDGSKEQKFFTRDEITFNINSLVSADGETITDYSDQYDINFKPVNVYLNAELQGNYTDTFTLNNSNTFAILEPTLSITANSIGDRINASSTIYTNDTAFTSVVNINMLITYNIAYSNSFDFAQTGTTTHFALRRFNAEGLETGTWGAPNLPTLSEDNSPYIGGGSSSSQITVVSGGYIVLHLFLSRGSTPFPYNPDNDIILNINILYIKIYEKSTGQAESEVRCITVHDAMARLIQLSTSEDVPANILEAEPIGNIYNTNFPYVSNGEHSGLMVTTGWNIRGYDDKPFNISIRELFSTIDIMGFLGLYYNRINDVFEIKYKTEFYDEDTIIYNLGEVTEFRIIPYKEMYFNELNFGYNEKVEYEELQGANEFNVPCKHFVSMPVKKKYDLLTGINGDTIGMEIARRLPAITYSQRDTRYDEQRFIIHTDFTNTLQGINVTGGFQGSDEYYNTKYTPRENLKRWAKYINTQLYKEITPGTTFVQTQKNVYVEINNESELTGLSLINLSTEPIYHPEIYEFKAPLSKAMIESLNTNPHGVIYFENNNIEYAGYVLEINGEGYNKNAKYKLIKTVQVNKNYLFEDEELYNFEDNIQNEFE